MIWEFQQTIEFILSNFPKLIEREVEWFSKGFRRYPYWIILGRLPPSFSLADVTSDARSATIGT